MNTTVKMVLSLTVISVLAGGILQAWEGFTKPLVEHHAAEKIKKAVAKVLPPYDTYEEKKVGDLTLYIGKKEGQEEPVGIAFYAQGNGFQGTVGIMVGVTGDLSSLTGIQVLQQLETPGLGDKIVKDPSNRENPHWFAEQFKGISTDGPVNVLKNKKPSNNTEIQAITGATISSKSVSRIVSEFYKKVKEVVPEFVKQKSSEQEALKSAGGL
jgi:electron transport complex protein RnfG